MLERHLAVSAKVKLKDWNSTKQIELLFSCLLSRSVPTTKGISPAQNSCIDCRKSTQNSNDWLTQWVSVCGKWSHNPQLMLSSAVLTRRSQFGVGGSDDSESSRSQSNSSAFHSSKGKSVWSFHTAKDRGGCQPNLCGSNTVKRAVTMAPMTGTDQESPN